jgi:hypothetical protein
LIPIVAQLLKVLRRNAKTSDELLLRKIRIFWRVESLEIQHAVFFIMQFLPEYKLGKV